MMIIIVIRMIIKLMGHQIVIWVMKQTIVKNSMQMSYLLLLEVEGLPKVENARISNDPALLVSSWFCFE